MPVGSTNEIDDGVIPVVWAGMSLSPRRALPFDGHFQALAYVQGGRDHHSRDEAFVGTVHLFVAVIAAGQHDRQGDEQQPGE